MNSKGSTHILELGVGRISVTVGSSTNLSSQTLNFLDNSSPDYSCKQQTRILHDADLLAFDELFIVQKFTVLYSQGESLPPVFNFTKQVEYEGKV